MTSNKGNADFGSTSIRPQTIGPSDNEESRVELAHFSGIGTFFINGLGLDDD